MIERWSQSFEYSDDDGFEIDRQGKKYFVYGTATGDYDFRYCNEPGEEGLEMECLYADFTVDEIVDDDGTFDTGIVLNAKERRAWESCMQVLLDNYAYNTAEPREEYH